ncbi:neutral zinc metallopeptidase [Crossiella sp. SN42]|uniref:neutral zinc metallopeptidase n=1 Tax=Crossiella sp. SN42 TaxID=2944808 RepID=UPI00207C9811|nr:neutral zinc metallopeptidase [Crossiella sp. SN42]MCO1578130.1 neutral zinc metallopeptidase [Crossiella sp. SN42]
MTAPSGPGQPPEHGGSAGSGHPAYHDPYPAYADYSGYLDPEPPKPPRRRKNSPLTILLVLVVLVGSVVVYAKVTANNAAEPDNSAQSSPNSPGTTAAPGSTQPSPAPLRPRPTRKLEDHPLMVDGGKLAFAQCDLPKIGRATDQLRTYYLAGIDCLERAWTPLLESANLPTHKVELDTSADITETACGKADKDEQFVAMYCSRNSMIYMPTKRLLRVYGTSSPGGHLATLAHEYGHHVQSLSGMLAAAGQKQEEAGEGTPGSAELSRRLEMQANCFAGMFLAATVGRGTVTKALADKAVNDFRQADDSPDSQSSHGTGKNQGAWAKRGYASGNAKDCNTWAAKPADVK